MKSYRCVVRGASLLKTEITLDVTAPDCRAAAKAALVQARAPENSWIEVFDGEEMVLMQRKSNLHPLQAAIQVARSDIMRSKMG